jgi:hypothetical protein
MGSLATVVEWPVLVRNEGDLRSKGVGPYRRTHRRMFRHYH